MKARIVSSHDVFCLEVNNLPLFLKWAEQSLIPHLYEQDWYNGDKVMNRTGFTSARVSKRLGRIRLRQARIQNGESFLSSKTQQIMKEQRAVSSRQLLFSLIPLVLTFHHLKYISPHGLTDPEFSFSVFFNLTQKATEKLGLN